MKESKQVKLKGENGFCLTLSIALLLSLGLVVLECEAVSSKTLLPESESVETQVGVIEDTNELLNDQLVLVNPRDKRDSGSATEKIMTTDSSSGYTFSRRSTRF